MSYFQIAIDGPVAAGKGTVSKAVAKELGFLYVDTGATYRVATLIALRNNFDLTALDTFDPLVVQELVSRISQTHIEMHVPVGDEIDGRMITVIVDSEDVSWAIRDESISSKVYIIAKIPEVREIMVQKQQEIARGSDVVMEGRDITYRVLPDAQLKIYLDASQEERIHRRIEQLKSQGVTFDSNEVAEEIKKRDHVDMTRETDPLQIVAGAWHFDVTEISIQEAVHKICEKVKELRKE